MAAPGWVVELEATITSHKTGLPKTIYTFWYGPRLGGWPVSGPLEHAHIFDTRVEALRLAHQCYGTKRKLRAVPRAQAVDR